MVANTKIKTSAIPRAGYEYQDLAGIELLIRHYRDPDLYEWVLLEADDTNYHALDDVVAKRKDGSYELLQVKFTVDAGQYELDWDWLLAKSSRGTSLLQKWASSLKGVSKLGPVHSAGLKTNRVPSVEFGNCLNGTRLNLELVPSDVRSSLETECGGSAEAKEFFSSFEFFTGVPDLNGYESALRDQLVPTDTDVHGWLVLRDQVQRWATYKNQPAPDGRILREHVVKLITKKRPQSLRQDFIVPEGYSPPSRSFDQSIRDRIEKDESSVTILWGTPGRGKSTYLSFLTEELQKQGAAVTRHHYFLSAEDSSSNRSSFTEIATSLLDQLRVRHSKVMAGVSEKVNEFHSAIELAAANFAENGQRLYIVIDGLDHVWRDTHRVDQLDHLFATLLPLPTNVSLIVGTQRVSDEQLPKKLLTIADDDDWVEIPRMDEESVCRWVIQQDKARPLLLRFDPGPDRRVEIINEIARAFFHVSQGHPLHLIYAYETLIRTGRAISAEDVELMPPCPDGDIRTYYKGLWVRLSSDAKNTLHVLAGSEFFWPSLGIRQTLGDFSEIDFLLEPRNSGMVPFHPSIFSWVQERPDHAESYSALLPKIVNWLAKDAPEYWQWGWLWLAQAQAGDCKNLLDGTTRDWVVASLAKGWPDQQIENILAAAEAKAFEDGDLPRTVELHSLKARVSNAREFQSRDFAAYRATALAVSENRQQTLNLLDDIHSLEDSEVLEIAWRRPEEIAPGVRSACFNELARRVNTWILLRHRPDGEFMELSDQFLLIGSLMDENTVGRTLRFARGYRDPEPHVSSFISMLGEAQNIKGLQVVRKALRGKKWATYRRRIDDALIRAGSFVGANAKYLVSPRKKTISAFAACWFLWRNQNAKHTVHIDTTPGDLLQGNNLQTENEDIIAVYYNAFWAALRVGLIAGGNSYDIIHPRVEGDDPGWLPCGLIKLEEIAKEIAKGGITPTFSAVYTAAGGVDPVLSGSSFHRERVQYSAFCKALILIATDLHLLGIEDPTNTKVSAYELALARRSPHWSDVNWVSHNVENQACFLDKDGAASLLTDESKRLLEEVTEFSERGEYWVQLADLARLYNDERQLEFLMHAAECLVGYGSHKDLGALEVLDSVVQLATKDLKVTQSRLDTIVPIIDVVTEFTDGDETGYIRSDLIKVVAKVEPERLVSFYERFLSADEYSYADECLIEFTKMVDLESAEGAALARTLLDERTLRVLEQRAKKERAAQVLLDTQNTFLGRSPSSREDSEADGGILTDEEGNADSVDPVSFGPDEFSALVDASASVDYKARDQFMAMWLHHWKDQGKGPRALRSIQSFFELGDSTFGAESILDEAFQVSLDVEGKDTAYSWLVKAHIHRSGWQSYYTSESEIMSRINLAALHYSDRWFQYIKDTSVPVPYLQRQGFNLVLGYKYLVRFLMLVGQVELADKITASLINTLVEEVREQPIPEAPWFR